MKKKNYLKRFQKLIFYITLFSLGKLGTVTCINNSKVNYTEFLEEATNSSHDSNKIGQLASATVYKVLDALLYVSFTNSCVFQSMISIKHLPTERLL